MFEKHKLHVKQVESDPEFIKALKKLPELSKDSIEQFENIAMEYAIYIEEIEYIKSGIKMSEFKRPYVSVGSASNRGTIFVFVDSQATKDEYIKAWDKVVEGRIEVGVKPTKRKQNENPELVYSIFRARIKGYKFSEIFENYKTGKLQNYTGPNTQFDTAEELIWFFSKHNPDKLYEDL